MHRNKKDVDKHVESLMFKLSSKDFKTRAYSIARLYYEVGDYGSCQRFVEQYLTQKSNNAAAHKLLGQALQKLGQKEKALEQYKISYDLDPSHTATILDVCELLADDEVVIDFGRAKFWCKKAEDIFPEHPVTFRLREKLLSGTNPDPEELVKLLKSELEVRPNDAGLHARLLKHFLSQNKYIDAFDHSCTIEFDKNLFPNNFAWYEALSEILKYNSMKANDWLYQLLLLTVREKLCALSLTEVQTISKGLPECVDYLHAYDQALESVITSRAPPGFPEFYHSLINHHQGQLVFHFGTYLLKKAKKDHLNWRDAKKFSAPLMLLAWQSQDSKVTVSAHAPERQNNMIRRWHIECSFRCSQSGHYLLSVAQEKSQILLDQISQLCSGTNWKDKIYKMIFTASDQQSKMNSSYLVSKLSTIPSLRLPKRIEVQGYDEDAQRQYPNSLHHFIWILLNYKNYAELKCTMFDMLTTSMTSCGPETLNKMDILAFLYCSTLTAQKHRDKMNYMIIEKPVLPANITDLLCSLSQMKWWDCAYKFNQNELGGEYTDIRSTLSRGLEVVRCNDNHGLDPVLLTILGRIFSKLASSTDKLEEKTNLELRSCLYYSSAIPLLEKLKKKLVSKLPERRMFDYMHEELDAKELNNLLEESKMYVALNHLNDGEYEKVINLLSTIKSPQAYYHLSKTYKELALDEKKTSKSTDVEEKYAMLLGKAKNFAYKAVEQIKKTDLYKEKTLYKDMQELINEIESYLNRIDPESSFALNDDTSDENGSASEILCYKSNILKNTSSTPKQITRHNYNVNSTAYRTALDSQIFNENPQGELYLERIEKHIKNLQKRESSINDFMDQTRDWFEENRKLGNQIVSTINSNIDNTTEQFKQLKISVDQIKDQIDECRKECKDVVELKKQIADLKKEVSKMKKTTEQIEESELYNLDEDYCNNENSSTFGTHLPFTTPQVISQFGQRLIPPFPLTSNPYQLYGQNFYNLYNQYSQFAQPPPVPGATPIFDPTRVQMNFPGVYPTPEQILLEAAQLANTNLPGVPNVASTPAHSINNASSIAPVSIATVPSTVSKLDTKDTLKSLPVNVVITSSDPLPTCTSTPAPVLSVTIPQKHIKGSPHNYQIQLPQANDAKTVAPPVFQFPSSDKLVGLTSSSSTLNWNAKSIFSTSKPENSFLSSDSKDIDSSKNVVDGVFSGLSPNTSLNKSRTLSEKSNTSIENYDPCPDFKPIVPLPAEVKVTTGEEDEVIIFSARAKLYRFAEKQWKERGIGEMKLLKHKITGKVRVLMRREQVHKICANHIILPEMEIKPMKNETKAYFWVANDFAEETVVLEKFCIRFKTPDIAKEFFEKFENARKESANTSKAIDSNINTVDTSNAKTNIPNNTSISVHDNSGKTVVGGFVFNSKPSFKSTEIKEIDKKSTDVPSTKVNVFSGLSFKTTTSSSFSNIINASNSTSVESTMQNKSNNASKLNTSDSVEEFEPTTEFKPVVPLPALIDQKTGEEDEIVLFEHRAKLLRFSGKEWKERGLGNIKLLMHKNNNQKLRLLMRREQIMKVCCNHAVTKEMTLQKMTNMDKAVTWCAKDFSEGELVSETFCLRFKTVEACDDFMNAVKNAQSKIGDEMKAAKEENNAAKQYSDAGFGNKFKPKPGSWTCDTCYTNNLESLYKCACCETPNPHSVISTNTKPTLSTSSTSNWGDKFKPKAGSWECKDCLIHNNADNTMCVACNSSRDPTVKNEEKPGPENNTPKFNFFVPSNNSNMQSSETKFTFGIPQNNASTTTSAPAPIGFNTNATPKFSFGIPQNKTVTFGVSSSPVTVTQSFINVESESAAPINFSTKNTEKESSTIVTPTKPAIFSSSNSNFPSFGQDKGSFQFSFKPKTPPTKGKSPSKSPKDKTGDDSDDNEYASDDEGHNIHFSPVIPMPDKIEVVTGEEDEDELYGHRAKLFIFNAGEWKERGIGVVRILKHKETGKLRVVMRREQVHKICLNHALTSDNIYKPKDEKTWLFAANDFSEGEVVLQNFCLRFQNKDISLLFKEAIDKAIKEKYGGHVSSDKVDCNKDTEDDNVIFVAEIQATNEEKQKAKELMLPENFYTYKIKEPCEGCRGCNDDDVKPETEKGSFSTVKSLLKQELTKTPLKTSPFSFQSPSSSIYGTPNVFDTTIFRTPLGDNGTNSNLSPSTSTNSSLLGSILIDKENTLTENTETAANLSKSLSFASQTNALSSVLAAPKLFTGPSVDISTSSSNYVLGTTDSQSIFGESKIGQSSTKSIFGFNLQPQNKEVMQSADNKSIFSVDYKTPTTVTQNIFGNLKSNQSSGIFGTGKFTFGPTQSNQEKPKSVFGKTENTSIFNDKPDTMFNKNKENLSNTESPGNFTFGKNVIMQNQDGDKIDTKTATPVMSSQNTEGISLNKDAKPVSDIQGIVKEQTPFNIDSSLSFAALSSSGPGFGMKKTDFKWEGAGQQLFNTKSNEVGDISNNDEANKSGAGTGVEEEYDPHYEPIVPLPDKIVVTTGEEDEEKIYGERSKLYRYDDKTREWKERGVGEMKVLYHPAKNSYRMLLRREQVHKAVLNMLIFKDLELLPMKNSDRAWTWCGRNFAESAGEQETLAVRFKSVDIANDFHAKVMQCVRKLQVLAAEAIRNEKEGKEQKFESITPLRLPKHLEADARADNLISATVLLQSTETKAYNEENAKEVTQQSEAEQSQQEEYQAAQPITTEYDEDYDPDEYEHNEDSEGYYNEEEETSVYYPCKAVVKKGNTESTCDSTHIQVSFDQEFCSPKILVTDSNTGEILADMLIHTDTEFQLSGDTCTWTGLDYATNSSVEKTLTITFPDADTAMEFHDSCETSKAATYASTDSES